LNKKITVQLESGRTNMSIKTKIPVLAKLLSDFNDMEMVAEHDLKLLPPKGLAHDHISIGGRNLLLRVPKQSQMALDAEKNLIYQAACFKKATPSGHTPKLHHIIYPSTDLPMGALIVEEIKGESLKLPDFSSAMATALASIHSLPVPKENDRAPLINPRDAVNETFMEVMEQSAFLANANLEYDSEHQIREELSYAGNLLSRKKKPPVSLITFDAHPGNFLITPKQDAILVDLEKARYGIPAYDLAHATLYTSTTWEKDNSFILNPDQVASFYSDWIEKIPKELAIELKPWLIDLRRTMWLWSVTWCAKWRVRSKAPANRTFQSGASTEDWSEDITDSSVVAHVRNRVDHYLDPNTIENVRKEWLTNNALTDFLHYSPAS